MHNSCWYKKDNSNNFDESLLFVVIYFYAPSMCVVLGYLHVVPTVRSFVCYCGHGSILLWTPPKRRLHRSNAPTMGEEG